MATEPAAPAGPTSEVDDAAVEPRVASLRTRHARADISLDRGMNAFAFAVLQEGRWVEVLHSEPGFAGGDGAPTRSGIPLLVPFPNRIRDATFNWHREDWHLPADLVRHDAHGHAIHGLVLDEPFRLVEQSKRHVVAEFQLAYDAPHLAACWPVDFECRVTWRLTRATLRCTIEVRNVDQRGRILPWGIGAHPWFRTPIGLAEPGIDLTPEAQAAAAAACRIAAPAAQRWILDDERLPTGELEPVSGDHQLVHGRALGGLDLDNLYHDLARDEAGVATSRLIDDAAGLEVQLRQSERMRELVIYTPPGGHAVCLEPLSCATDAVHLERQGFDSGLGALELGATAEAWFEIELARLG